MNNEIIKIDSDNKEITTVEELVDGCKNAIVTFYADKNYRMHKIVTFSEEKEFWKLEELSAAINKKLAKREDICVSKSFLYNVEGLTVKKASPRFFTMLYRTLLGFMTDNFTHDLRHLYANDENETT